MYLAIVYVRRGLFALLQFIQRLLVVVCAPSRPSGGDNGRSASSNDGRRGTYRSNYFNSAQIVRCRQTVN